MGDRCVIGFRESKKAQPIWLYSHWGGSERAQDIVRALEASKPRWDQPDYATRIAISTIVGDAWAEETGFGISTGDRNYAHPDYDEVHIVNWEERSVSVVGLDGREYADIGFEVFRSITPVPHNLF